MDLLGDLGHEDQLSAARAENTVLQAKVKELAERVKELAVENEALKAEVEIYRQEAALTVPRCSLLSTSEEGGTTSDGGETAPSDEADDEFVRAGNGQYTNPTNPDETVLASGGADSSVVLCQWGAADNGTEEAAAAVVDQACRLACSAPVIDLAFSCTLRGVLAMGCMDGSVCIAHYETTSGCLQATSMATEARHQKYVRAVAWAPTRPLLATSSADGSVLVFKVEKKLALLNDEEEESTEPPLTIQLLQSLHFSGSVETICFSNDKLICYARGTPYLSYFDLDEDFNQTKINLNKASDSATGGFEDHVSFAVMDMVCRDNKYLACATDTSRNIILELSTGKQIRNLYGHQNDLYSQPKIAWSANGQYIYGNTQEESCVCVWDIASSQIVERLQGGHAHPIRALYSSPTSDTLVTTSFDKKTKLWFAPIATKEEL